LYDSSIIPQFKTSKTVSRASVFRIGGHQEDIYPGEETRTEDTL